ncbi:MAG: hypothetical protein J0I94_08615 [Thiobacillus sp.]|nr:hypothetical protein [Thiobacillus sp.]
MAIAAAWVIGPYVANSIYGPLATSAAQAAAVTGTTLTYSQVATMWVGANIAGGAAAGFTSGLIVGGDIRSGLNGAIGGAILGPVTALYGGSSWSLERLAVQSGSGGLASAAQGGSFADGLRNSFLDGSISYAWEYTRGYTDALKLKAVANLPGEILGYNQHGELLTDGARSCIGSSTQCAGLFDSLVMAREAGGKHLYSENSFIGRFVNWTSKTHDFMNSWNYDKKIGGWIGRGVVFNSFYDFTSFAGMLPAAVFTGYAKSLEMAPGAVDAIHRAGRY